MPPAVRRHSSSTDTVEFDPDQMQAHLAEAAQLLKALGNEQRLHILCNLLEGPLSVGELNQRLELSQSALSQHLALLRESGLVDTRREAQTIYYSLPDGPVIRVMALLQDVYCPADPASRSGDASGAARVRCED
jgi:DNA-binding transcriptional ArsR family regulator